MLRSLHVTFPSTDGPIPAVNGVDLDISPGEIIGLAGESGSGKTVTCRSILGLLPWYAESSVDQMILGGVDLGRMDQQSYTRVRGRIASLVTQEPTNALNRHLTVGVQLRNVCELHNGPTGTESRRTGSAGVHTGTGGLHAGLADGRPDRPDEHARFLLNEVGLADSDRIARAYPRELSGGMCQRVAIALALAARPALLVADEPTSSLDVTTQGHILDLLLRLRESTGMSILLVTHDLGVANHVCDTLAVMQNGVIREQGTPGCIFGSPTDDYTRRLVAAVPSVFSGSASGAERDALAPAGDASSRDETEAVLSVRDLGVSYPVTRGVLIRRTTERIEALAGITFDVYPGTVLGVVGESGAGKSTLVRACLRIESEAYGSVRLDGAELEGLSEAELSPMRRRMQVVFQDPSGSIDPTYASVRAVREPLDHFRIGSRGERWNRAISALCVAGLGVGIGMRTAPTLSGGQRQRVSLARAVAEPPRILFADEPVSALDVSVQADVLDLLRQLVEELRFAMVLVSHDLAVIRQIADDVLVLKDGRCVEMTSAADFFSGPESAYGRQLLEAAVRTDMGRS
jgi:peptide/nickel transport system ATP-binding protein